MIVSDELRAWVNDREGQHRTRSLSDRLTDEWSRGPVHRRFTTAMAALPVCTAEAVAEAVRELFADDEWVDQLVGTLADAMRGDRFLDPPFRHINSDIHGGLIVFEDDNVSIAAGVSAVADIAAKKTAPRGATSLGFSGQVGIFKFVRAGGARLSFWEAPRITAGFTAAGAGLARFVGERDIADGEILIVDGRFQTFVIEQAAANLVVLQATVKPDQAPLGVEYDARTFAYVGCSAADDSASRIQMIATLLRKLDCAAAFPAIAAFLDHPSFFVRWHLMRELLGLDAPAALPHLKRMAAGDPHPETRRAARTVLDRIEGQIARKAA
jgi:hypothetical protein